MTNADAMEKRRETIIQKRIRKLRNAIKSLGYKKANKKNQKIVNKFVGIKI